MGTTVESDFGPIDIEERRNISDAKFHHFDVSAPDATGRRAGVWMDGEELKGVIAVKIDVNLDDSNRITITFIPGSLNRR